VMQLTVTRDTFTAASTTGVLSIDGSFFCYTLEPRQDQSNGKPYCIPTGTYQVLLQESEEFSCVTPHIIGVPGFTAIEMHWGNFPADTEGCTVLGQSRTADAVWYSRQTFGSLMLKLTGQTGITVTYTNQEAA
jgi:hypothetical protein